MHEVPPLPTANSSGTLALVSMICGILVLPTCFATLLPALICGHMALSRGKRAGEPTGKAMTGLILGYGALALIPVIAAVAGLTAPLIIRQRDKADLTMMISSSRSLSLALNEYESEHGRFPSDLADLETERLVYKLDVLLELPARHQPGEWLYFPNADPDQGDEVLLISPPVREKRAVTRVDGSVRSTPAEEEVSVGTNEPLRIPAPSESGR